MKHVTLSGAAMAALIAPFNSIVVDADINDPFGLYEVPVMTLPDGELVYQAPSSGGMIQIVGGSSMKQHQQKQQQQTTPADDSPDWVNLVFGDGDHVNESTPIHALPSTPDDDDKPESVVDQFEVDISRLADLTMDSIELDMRGIFGARPASGSDDGDDDAPPEPLDTIVFRRNANLDNLHPRDERVFEDANEMEIDGSGESRRLEDDKPRSSRYRRVQDLALSRDALCHIVFDAANHPDCQFDIQHGIDYLPPNDYHPPHHHTQRFQYFDGNGLFEVAIPGEFDAQGNPLTEVREATVMLKQYEDEDGDPYLGGMISAGYDYVFELCEDEKKTCVTVHDPNKYASMPEPIDIEEWEARKEEERRKAGLDGEEDEEGGEGEEGGYEAGGGGRKRKKKRTLKNNNNLPPRRDNPFDEQIKAQADRWLEREQRRLQETPNYSDGSIIDILVPYTKNAFCNKNSIALGETCTKFNVDPLPSPEVSRARHQKMIQVAQDSVDWTNVAYLNSKIRTQLRLVHTYMTDYNDVKSCDHMINGIRNDGDGIMDEVHDKRIEWGADLVALLTSHRMTGCGGVAFVGPRKDLMFSVQRYGVHSTFAHEVGHNFGCYHDRINSGNKKEYEYGWHDRQQLNIGRQEFRTIMAYNCQRNGCGRIQYFSNPTERHLGRIMGDAANDCARKHNKDLPTIAQFVGVRITSEPTYSQAPSVSGAPSTKPSITHSLAPSTSSVPSLQPSTSSVPSTLPSGFPTFNSNSLEEDFLRLDSPRASKFEISHGQMFDVTAKGHAITIHSFRLPFTYGGNMTISIWSREHGNFWYEKNNADAWTYRGSTDAFSPGITLTNPVPLKLRGGFYYGFEPIVIPANTTKGVYIFVNRTTGSSDNLMGTNSKRKSGCAIVYLNPFNFDTWLENEDLAVSEGVVKENWFDSTGTATHSFRFTGSLYYRSERPGAMAGLSEYEFKPSESPSLSVEPSFLPSEYPSSWPSSPPSDSGMPSASLLPSIVPSSPPSTVPSSSLLPSSMPSNQPSSGPTASQFPSTVPSSSHHPSSTLSPGFMAPSSGPSSSLVPSASSVPSFVPTSSSVPSVSLAPTRHALVLSAPTAYRNFEAIDGIMFEVHAINENIVIRGLKVSMRFAGAVIEDVDVSLYTTPGSYYNMTLGDSVGIDGWTHRGTAKIAASVSLAPQELPASKYSFPIHVPKGSATGIYITAKDPEKQLTILSPKGNYLLENDFYNDDVVVRTGLGKQWNPCLGWGLSIKNATTLSPRPFKLFGSIMYDLAGTSKPTVGPTPMHTALPSISSVPSASIMPSPGPSTSLRPSENTDINTPSAVPSASLAPSSELAELITRQDIEGDSADGVMFDIVANRKIEIYSIQFGQMANYPMKIRIYTRIGSHYAVYDDESQWDLIKVYANYTGDPEKPHRLSFPPQMIPAGQTRAFYIAIVETYGGQRPLRSGMLVGHNYYTGVWEENDHMKLMEGMKFHGVSESRPFGNGTDTSGVSMHQGPGGLSYNMKDATIRYKAITTIAPSVMPSISQVPSMSQVPSIRPTTSDPPSEAPSISFAPSTMPTDQPSVSTSPSGSPSSEPSGEPSISLQPSENPSISAQPSSVPSEEPSTEPTMLPSESPSISFQPSGAPTMEPSDVPSISSKPTLGPSVSLMPSMERYSLLSNDFGGGPLAGVTGTMFDITSKRGIVVNNFHIYPGTAPAGTSYTIHIFTRPGSYTFGKRSNQGWTKITEQTVRTGSSPYLHLAALNSMQINPVTIYAGQTQAFYIALTGHYFIVQQVKTSFSNDDLTLQSGMLLIQDLFNANGGKTGSLFQGKVFYSKVSDPPSLAPSEFPSGDPSGIPSVAPSGTPIESPSHVPSTSSGPSEMSEVPSAGPSASLVPTVERSHSPSKSPINPTVSPSTSPSISVAPTPALGLIQITIPSSITIQGFGTPETNIQFANVISILVPSILDVLRVDLTQFQTVENVIIKSIGGNPVPAGVQTKFNRMLRRQEMQQELQQWQHRRLEGTPIEYDIVLSEPCGTNQCSNAQEVADELVNSVTTTMNTVIGNGAFIATLQSQTDEDLNLVITDIAFEEAIVVTPSSQPSGKPSSMPSENPSSQPSGVPSEAPSGVPSSQPSRQPSSMPSENPTSLPSSSLSVQPSSVPSGSPSSRPSGVPSESPSSVPSKDPSGQPSSGPSESPSSVPSQAPSDQPSSIPSERPSSLPSTRPSSQPSEQPSESSNPTVSSAPSSTIGRFITIGKFVINADVCNLSDDDRVKLVKATVTALEEAACGDDSLSCVAQVINICNNRLNTSRSLQWTPGGDYDRTAPTDRRLQQTSEIEFQIIADVVCRIAACTDDEDIVNAMRISQIITTRVNTAIQGGFLISVLQSIEGFVLNCLAAWGGISLANSNSELLSVSEDAVPTKATFYPDWEGGSGTCINDDNAPLYQKLNPSEWVYDNLEACCDRYYSGYEKAKCINKQGSGLWVVDWINGRCALDCEESIGALCGGVIGGIERYSDPLSCCESELPWISSKFCEDDSLDLNCYDGTNKYYSSGKTCVKDCKSASSNCGGIVHEPHVALYDSLNTCCAAKFGWITRGLCISRSNSTVTEKYWPDMTNSKCVKDSEKAAKDLSVQLFDTAKECCETSIVWERSVACIASSTGEVAQGSSDYFVDWIKRKCVQDCEGAAPCGGIAKKWDVMYASRKECCDMLWNDPDECYTR